MKNCEFIETVSLKSFINIECVGNPDAMIQLLLNYKRNNPIGFELEFDIHQVKFDGKSNNVIIDNALIEMKFIEISFDQLIEKIKELKR